MEWLLPVFLLIIGLALIIKGGSLFVDAACWIAERTGIPPFIIGATVVSLATTMPELLVSLMAAAGGKIDMAVGNAVGSVTANTGLIMGISLVCIPSAVSRRAFLPRTVLMLGATAVLLISGLMSGGLTFRGQILLVVLFVIAMADNLRQARRTMNTGGGAALRQRPVKTAKAAETAAIPGDPATAERKRGGIPPAVKYIGGFVAGAALLVVGSDILVKNATILARLLGISERIIGVTIVAVGTSLPELTTTVTAIAKKRSDLSVGNIIGANILNLTMILPVSALVAGNTASQSRALSTVDLPACLLIGSVALIPTLITGKFQRWQGALLLTLYVAYLVVTVLA